MPTTSLVSPAAAESLATEVDSASDSTPVRFNSRAYQRATGDSIGFQSKPNQVVTSSGNVIGGQVSPRLASGIALTGSGSLIGFHVDTDMKGAAGGNVAGDVRGMEIEIVSDLASGRTIAGRANGIRFRTNLSATVTGNVSAIRVPTGEAAGGQWDALADIDNVASVFDDTDTNTAGTKRGFLRVIVNGSSRFIRLYDSGV